ncbi:hypothetical protein CHUAL_001035 [Chamberlinius hualienensis]
MTERMFTPSKESSKEFGDFLKNSCFRIFTNHIFNSNFSTSAEFFYYKNCLLSKRLLEGYFKNLKVKVNEEDVILATFPRTCSQLVHTLIHLVVNGADETENIDNQQLVFLEDIKSDVDKINKDETPIKVFRTHLPHHLLQERLQGKKNKIIYVYRNSLDTVHLMHEYFRKSENYKFTGGLSSFINLFVHDCVIYSPIRQHIVEYLNQSQTENTNILFLPFEFLQRNLKVSIKRISGFLHKDLNDEQIERIFKRMYIGKFTDMLISRNPTQLQLNRFNQFLYERRRQ